MQKLQWIGIGLVKVLLLAITVSGKQSFDEEPEYQEVNPGEDAVIRCRVFEKSRNSLCIWQKEGKPIRLQDGKYEWNGSADSGDCSLRVLRADINYDDGEWICQVSSSSYDTDDGLASRPARLVVRVPPSEPKMFYEGLAIDKEHDLQLRAGQSVRLRCESRSGNPAATLQWYLDDELYGTPKQSNETAEADGRLWNAISILETSFEKSENGKILKCVSVHDAFSRKSREVMTRLDILYAPVVRLERNDALYDLEADVDRVHIRCSADGNPAPKFVWRKSGEESAFRLGPDLVFDPVRQGEGGTYYCLARNSVGSSDELSISFEVLYEPRNLRTDPNRVYDVTVGDRARFECSADGNPNPKFEWQQKYTNNEVYVRGTGRKFQLDNITYAHEGVWMCVATNKIKGEERSIESGAIRVDVTGKPQVLHQKTNQVQMFERNVRAELRVIFCSDPRPRDLVWEWGNLKLGEGESQGRYSASKLRSEGRPDCYVATLSVDDVAASDSRTYYLVSSNDQGRMRHGVKLEVLDPISMATAVSILAALLFALVVIVIVLVYAYKKRKCCFKLKKRPVTNTTSRGTSFYSATVSPQRQAAPTVSAPSQQQHQMSGLPKAEALPSPPAYSSHPSGEYQRQQQHKAYPKNKEPRPDYIDHGSQASPASDSQSSPSQSTVYKTVLKREPTYPLPPQSQFPLGKRTKTPQNSDAVNNSSSSLSTILYADLQLPRSVNGGSTSVLGPQVLPGRVKTEGSGQSMRSSVAATGSFYPRSSDRAEV